MLLHVVEEGQRVLVRHPDGTMEVVAGPRRIWKGRKTFLAMKHHVAHPGEYLIVRHRDGRQEHRAGQHRGESRSVVGDALAAAARPRVLQVHADEFAQRREVERVRGGGEVRGEVGRGVGVECEFERLDSVRQFDRQ